MTSSIHDVLSEIRATATDERDKGGKFEELIAAYLSTEPQWVARFDGVWKWNQWPGRDGKPDTGIDLVARERETGQWCAIQCKFYDEAHHLAKADIDSFFTASGKAGFATRLIVSTTDKWGKNAEDALADQQIPVTRLRTKGRRAQGRQDVDHLQRSGHLDRHPARGIRLHARLPLSD